MLSVPKTPWGGRISKAQAQHFYKNFIKIKNRSVVKITGSLENDGEATRFHCGKTDAQGNISLLDTIFIFEHVFLKELLKGITDGGLAVILGSRDCEDSPCDPPTPGTYKDVDGRPTLMLFPFNKSVDSKTGKTSLVFVLDEGTEHPGTGRPGGTFRQDTSQQNSGGWPSEIPDSISADDVEMRDIFKPGHF